MCLKDCKRRRGGSGGAPADERLAGRESRDVRETLAAHEAAGDARRLGERTRRDQEAQTLVARAAHRAAARVHHKAHEEPADTNTADAVHCTQHIIESRHIMSSGFVHKLQYISISYP